MADEQHLISERGRALILAAAVLDRPSADPDDDLAILARQLTRAQEEVDQWKEKWKAMASASLTLGLLKE